MARLNQPLSDAEFARIAAILERSGRAMNVEMVDGFFAALICGPGLVGPSEYLRMIWGGDPIGGETGWRDEAEMQEYFELLMRHWNFLMKSAAPHGRCFRPTTETRAACNRGLLRTTPWFVLIVSPNVVGHVYLCWMQITRNGTKMLDYRRGSCTG